MRAFWQRTVLTILVTVGDGLGWAPAPSSLKHHTPAGDYAACLGAGQTAVNSSSAALHQAAAPAMPTV